MKSAIIAIFVLLSSFTPALCQQQLDAATKEDVEQLLELTGARARVQQMWAAMAQQAAATAADAYRLKHPDATPAQLRKAAAVAGQYVQDSIAAVSVDELIAVIVPVYQRHLTHADVRSMIDFYTSPAGQKVLKEMPAMMTESMQAAQPVIQKHLPEMEAAAEKAAERSTKPRSSSGVAKPN